MLSSLWFLLIVPGMPLAVLFFWMWNWLRKRNKHSRHPFKDMPRPPGWSLQNRTEDLMTFIYDGVHLHFPQPMRPDRFGIEQAERNAAWLSAKLSQLNGIEVPVKSALVLPGWFIARKNSANVTVINEKEIAGFLSRRGDLLPPERLRAIRGQLQDMAKVEFA